jgi:hypothetical protein
LTPTRSRGSFLADNMKGHLIIPATAALVLASCETGELNTSGTFDPLMAPGSGRNAQAAQTGLRPGSYVRAGMDNAAFFKKLPKGDANADRQLPINTEVKVISDDGSFAKVELASGEVGYVPSVQLADPAAVPANLSPNAIQVYPLPPGALPPGGVDPGVPSIPPVIDPDAPVIPVDPSIPDVPPVPFEEPVVPPASTPLPPGIEAEDSPQVEGGSF